MKGIRKPLSRREFIKLGGMAVGATAAVPLLAACSSSSGDTSSASGSPQISDSLTTLVWEGYTDPAFVKGFEDKYGVKVSSTYIGSNDELVAKLRGGGAQLYDLCTPSLDTTKALIDAGIVQPIDTNNIPNWNTVYPVFKGNSNVIVNNQVYGIPMCWGVIPLLANLNTVPNPADTWAILWDPRYKGQIAVWNDISSIYNTALLLGYQNLYTLSGTQLDAVMQKMIEQKPLLRKYWSTAGELTNLFVNNEVVVANSFGGLTYTQLSDQGMTVKEWVPKEGATAWVDYWMIVKDTPNAYTAELFLNYIQDAKTQAEIAKVTGYGVTNSAVVKYLDPKRVAVYHQDDPAFIASLAYWQQVPERQKYLDVLNQVMAS